MDGWMDKIVPFHLVSDLLEEHRGAEQELSRHKFWSHPGSHVWSGLDLHLGLYRRKKQHQINTDVIPPLKIKAVLRFKF